MPAIIAEAEWGTVLLLICAACVIGGLVWAWWRYRNSALYTERND